MPNRMPIGRYTVATDLGPIELNSDERLVSIVESRVQLPQEREHPLQTLMRLSGVTTLGDLGAGGPPLASVANPENADNPEMRRYEDVFNDAFVAAKFVNHLFPALEDATVLYFAPYVSLDGSEGPGAEPGAVAHHFYVREKGRPPAYRRTDACLDFITAACRTIDRNSSLIDRPLVYPFGDYQGRDGQTVMRNGKAYTLGQAVLDVGTWLTRKLSVPGSESLLWIQRGNALGNSYTTWTDSPNHHHRRDGTLCSPPVANLLIQGKAYDALRALAGVIDRRDLYAAVAGTPALQPEVLAAQATTTKASVLRHFPTTDERGTFLSHAVDGFRTDRLEASGVQGIEMGQVLNTGLLDREREWRESTIEMLFHPRMLTPFGLRGRAADEVRSFRFDYHGQVWAFATHDTAEGLRGDARPGHHERTGYAYVDAANELDARAMRHTHHGLNPEFVGAGSAPDIEYCSHILTVEMDMADGGVTQTVKERSPQPQQAWTAAAEVAIDYLGRDWRPLTKVGGSTDFDRRAVGQARDRAFQTFADLTWSEHGSRSLTRAAREAAGRGTTDGGMEPAFS